MFDESPYAWPLLRERAVLHELPGHRDKEFAAALGLSVHGVRHHLRKLFAKLGVTKRGDAVPRAREHPRPLPSRAAVRPLPARPAPDCAPDCACRPAAAALQSRALDPRTGNAMLHQAAHTFWTVDAQSMAGMHGRNGGADLG